MLALDDKIDGLFRQLYACFRQADGFAAAPALAEEREQPFLLQLLERGIDRLLGVSQNGAHVALRDGRFLDAQGIENPERAFVQPQTDAQIAIDGGIFFIYVVIFGKLLFRADVFHAFTSEYPKSDFVWRYYSPISDICQAG